MSVFDELFDCMREDGDRRQARRATSAQLALDALRELKESPERQYRHLSYTVWLTHYVRMMYWNFFQFDHVWPRNAAMSPEELLVCKEEADLWWRAQAGEDTEAEWIRRFEASRTSAGGVLLFFNRRYALLRALALPLGEPYHVTLSTETARAIRPSAIAPIGIVLDAYPNIGPSRDVVRAMIARVGDIHGTIFDVIR